MASAAAEAAKRSDASLRFERVVREAAGSAQLPSLTDIDPEKLRELTPWIAMVHPDAARYTLKFTRAGAGIAMLLGRNPAGFDYLDVMDPAFKGEAFDSALLMASRPCGLWQISPVETDAGLLQLEFTGFPVFDPAAGQAQIAFVVHGAEAARSARIRVVRHAAEWQWIELRPERKR